MDRVEEDPLHKRERILEAEPWSSMRVTGFLQPQETPRWSIRRFRVPEGDRSQDHEKLHLNRYVPPGIDYTGLWRKQPVGRQPGGALVMSDTPDELTDHGPVIRRAAASSEPLRVLVNGLGLGCVVKGLLSLTNVVALDVVEIDRDLIELVGPFYLRQRLGVRTLMRTVRSKDGRLTIHRADAFTKRWPEVRRWNLIWHDVWDSMDPVNLSDEARAVPGTYDRLFERYADRCDWQGAWGEQLLRP
jgi:hypothetical protein